MSSASCTIPASSSRKPRVLIADDSPEQRWVVRAMLEPLGIETTELADGRELFWALERCHRAGALDSTVIIADVKMPLYNGLEVLEAWSQKEWSHRFIVMTAFPDADTVRRARALGATLLAKPFTTRELTKIVRRLIP